MYAQAMPEHPRVAGEVAVGQLGQLPVVVGGQVVADLAELLVDDGEVVDEPLRGRRDRPFVFDCLAKRRYDSTRTRPFSAMRGLIDFPRRASSLTF